MIHRYMGGSFQSIDRDDGRISCNGLIYVGVR